MHLWHHTQIDEITLLNTVLIKWDGLRIICPNNKLSMDLLINVTRSQKKGETFKVTDSSQSAVTGTAGNYACRVPAHPVLNQRLVSVQIQVDISTLPEVFERLEACVIEHISANPLDFSGECSVNANFGTDPMKFLLVVWWNYCYNGAYRKMLPACQIG